MALSVFDGASAAPTPAALKKALGKSAPLWKQLVDEVSDAHPPITEQWNCAGAKYGWSLRLKRRDRVVLYLIPQAGGFLAGIVLGEKAVKAALQAAPPAPVRALIDAAPRYAEGRGIRFPVKAAADVSAVRQLVAVKMAP